MSIPAIFLLLVSASLHAVWNFILKRSDDKYIAMGWQVIFGGVFALLLLFIVGLPPRSIWAFALVSMLLEAIYFILLSNAYTDNDFSLIYPIARGTAPAFIMLWSVLFLHEQPTTGGIVGIPQLSFAHQLSHFLSSLEWPQCPFRPRYASCGYMPGR